MKHLVAALVGFGSGWYASTIWTRLNASLEDSPVVRVVDGEGWTTEAMAHYPGPFYEGSMGDWVGDLPLESQRAEARFELGLPPWEERHGRLDPQSELNSLRPHVEAVIRRRLGG